MSGAADESCRSRRYHRTRVPGYYHMEMIRLAPVGVLIRLSDTLHHLALVQRLARRLVKPLARVRISYAGLLREPVSGSPRRSQGVVAILSSVRAAPTHGWQTGYAPVLHTGLRGFDSFTVYAAKWRTTRRPARPDGRVETTRPCEGRDTGSIPVRDTHREGCGRVA